jgi:hypothetical protein
VGVRFLNAILVESLGEDIYRDEYSKGTSLTYQQAVDLALREMSDSNNGTRAVVRPLLQPQRSAQGDGGDKRISKVHGAAKRSPRNSD